MSTDRSRRLGRWVASASRWLHIYTSMFSLAVILFFGATGLTLNHPAWFTSGVERHAEYTGQVPMAWLSGEVARLEIVEHLRATHDVGGAMAEFTADEFECLVTFKGPGYSADAFIDRESGEYTLTEVRLGLVAVLNDLHKGRDTGPIWSVLIDVSAVAMVGVSLTGLILLFYLKLRRRPGLAVALVGLAVALGLVFWGVP